MGPVLLNSLVLVVGAIALLLLLRPTWAHRYPCSALMLWCATAASMPLALVGSAVMFVTDGHLLSGGHSLVNTLAIASTLTNTVLTLIIGTRFARLAAKARKIRAKHRNLLSLFCTPHPSAKHVYTVPDERLFAYSVPSPLYGDIVLSQGFVESSSGTAVEAVIAHERMHLLARHHLLVQVASATADMVPGRRMRSLPENVSTLIELAADCWSSRRSDRGATITSLVTLADMKCPDACIPAGGRDVQLRLKQLASDQYRCCWSTASLAVLAFIGALILTLPTLVFSNQLTDLCLLLWEVK